MELACTPHGRITAVSKGQTPSDGAESLPEPAPDGRLGSVAKAFAAGQGEGLFLLATQRFDGPLAPSLAYWRDFAARYLTALCQTPEGAGSTLPAIPPPDVADLSAVLLSAPPMQGAEYLGLDPLAGVWNDLDQWVRAEVAACDDGLSDFLKRRAPLWHQVGRVCFHLAENRRDEDYPFAFLATYAPGVTAGARVQYQPLSHALRELAGARNKTALVRLLSPVQLASQKSPLVKELLDSGDLYQALAWTPRQAYRFLKEVPVLEESGVLVRLPDWWKKRPRPRAGIKIGDQKQAKFHVGEMLDFQLQRALGDQELTEAEWRELMASDDGLVLLRGQWVEVDRDKLQEALDHWRHVEEQWRGGLSFVEGMRLLAGAPEDLGDDTDGERDERAWSFVHAGQWLGDVLAKLRNPEGLQPLQLGLGLKGTLRKYQETGVGWLRFLSGLGLGACLADDMGLGKTIQVLGLLSALKNEGAAKPSLLVLPASLVANWKAEMARFTPSLRAMFVHPSELPKEELARAAKAIGGPRPPVDVVATTYGMLLRQPWLTEVPWRLVVLDEAQAIKNPGAKQTRAVKGLQAENRIILTGTPIENRLGDLWSLFDFLNPGLLGNHKEFTGFAKKLQDRPEGYARLRNLVKPYILRRMKTDKAIIADLPEKVEMKDYALLTKRQLVLYRRLIENLAAALAACEEGIQRKGLILATLMKAKQLCNHPDQYTGGGGPFVAEESGKFQILADICETIHEKRERALIFTQFREMTEPLAAFLQTVFHRPGLILHGGVPVAKRKGLVDMFQGEAYVPFMVLSLKAGGVGLNLTRANHVIHFDRWWNPAVENQATDRAFRIGQRRNVLVHKFVCRGTIEEKIDALIEEKTHLASDLLEGGAEKMLTEMTDAELIRFVSLDVAAATAGDSD